jgi:PTH1 family peptidyl-tRNA hydrolase
MGASVAKCPYGLLVQPQGYMNTSGEAAGALARYYRIPLEDCLVVTDDVYLAPGTARIRPTGGGDGGHNGLKSIHTHLGNIAQVRIGVGVYEQKPDERQHLPPLDEYVLQKLPHSDREQVDKLIIRLLPLLDNWMKGGILQAETIQLS